MLCGDDDNYYDEYVHEWGRLKTVAYFYLRAFSNGRQVLPLIRSVIIANMQPCSVCLHTNINRVPIATKEMLTASAPAPT